MGAFGRNQPAGDLYSKVFPGEAYELTFDPTDEQIAAVVALADSRGCADLVPMLLGLQVTA
ncbi:hypothetical protein DEI97_013530 [Curtobacterium sp. MCLR17_032]|uniref:hypothetical protein n=1 Tax=Curtobacterium sp. MCLR17_032 TaxID=2175650 RepID=UPI000DA9930B|nr:hypothetical protein [Curtobacterium sp. MCLR17_032]WIE60762.1 hypothetical protein DEI97_013530 [Curtobacterium sp. MCLR17_032]